jgi:hypothetical protein
MHDNLILALLVLVPIAVASVAALPIALRAKTARASWFRSFIATWGFSMIFGFVTGLAIDLYPVLESGSYSKVSTAGMLLLAELFAGPIVAGITATGTAVAWRKLRMPTTPSE